MQSHRDGLLAQDCMRQGFSNSYRCYACRCRGIFRPPSWSSTGSDRLCTLANANCTVQLRWSRHIRGCRLQGDNAMTWIASLGSIPMWYRRHTIVSSANVYGRRWWCGVTIGNRREITNRPCRCLPYVLLPRLVIGTFGPSWVCRLTPQNSALLLSCRLHQLVWFLSLCSLYSILLEGEYLWSNEILAHKLYCISVSFALQRAIGNA